MSSFAEIFKRIQLITNTKTQHDLANVLSIKQSSISDAKRRSSIPADWYMKLFETYRVNPLWLRDGEGTMFLRMEAQEGVYDDGTTGLAEGSMGSTSHMSKSLLVSVYGASCEYRDDEAAPPLPIVGKIALPSSFAEADITVLRVDAPNMEPCIARNAYVGINTTAKMPVSGTVFALYCPHEGLILRRLFLQSDTDCYLLRSEAPGYPEMSLDAAVLAKRLLGRVVWVLQKL